MEGVVTGAATGRSPGSRELLSHRHRGCAPPRRNRSNFARPSASLCCLRNTAGASRRARCFAEIYNWFTEGFDTADLKEAKALLDELSSEDRRV
jgi:hypothetical protein